MKQASRKSKVVHPIADKVVKNIREVLVFASLIFALYLLISLLSFNADDSAWSYSISNTVIQNHAGAVGAYIADLLLSVFGYFGYLIPFLFLMSGWRLYQARLNQKTLDHFIFSIHLIGVLLLFVGGCGILWMHFNANTWLPSEIRGAGGIIGYTVGPVLLKLTGFDGSTLII